MILFVYGWVMRVLSPLLLLKLYLRSRKEPLYGVSVSERFGYYSVPASAGGVWIHAVSLGETRAIQTLVAAIRQSHPGVKFVFTHGTATGREQGMDLLHDGDVQVWQPWDTPEIVSRFLRHFQPRAGFLVDTEVWPVMVDQAHQHGVPVVLLNARLSAKSLRRSMQWSALSRPAFNKLHGVWAQSEQDAKRFQALGITVQSVMGNLKFDAVPDSQTLQQGLAWRKAMARPVVLLAISREGEEAALLECLAQQPTYLQDVQWWLVPRHPQRFEQVAALVHAQGLSLQLRSDWSATPNVQACHSDTQVVLGDSMGEMPFYFGVASVCLLGGSFEPLGGQNLIEACACACPVVMGPHTYNFAQAAQLALQDGAAVRVQDMAQAVKTAHQLAMDRQACQQKSVRATEFAARHQGAVARCLQLMQPWL
ncbi:MAG: 3-deoxy-D-manno-octulosonic acid transferase [Limnohabitans sp.]